MPSTPPKHPRLLITVVSKNASTLEGLEAYLRGVGVTTTNTSAMDRLVEMTPPGAAAVIIFPDEYPPSVVHGALTTLKKQRPGMLAVIVTNDPRRFVNTKTDEAAANSRLVMGKPAWAWTIMDAVRARLDAKG